MPDNETDSEKLLILPLGDESKKITQVISNDTARQIIELLADAPLTASDISERLHAPLTTIIYNLENLESVGLVRVERIKYSEKGRVVKVYAPVRKIIVVVPEKMDRRSVSDLLRKYLGVILAAMLASGMIEFFMKPKSSIMIPERDGSFNQVSTIPLSNATAPNSILNGTDIISESQKSANIAVTPELPPVTQSQQGMTPDSVAAVRAGSDTVKEILDFFNSHPGLMFLLGCMFVILLLIAMDHQRKKKN